MGIFHFGCFFPPCSTPISYSQSRSGWEMSRIILRYPHDPNSKGTYFDMLVCCEFLYETPSACSSVGMMPMPKLQASKPKAKHFCCYCLHSVTSFQYFFTSWRIHPHQCTFRLSAVEIVSTFFTSWRIHPHWCTFRLSAVEIVRE
jgi:hypothetical protein